MHFATLWALQASGSDSTWTLVVVYRQGEYEWMKTPERKKVDFLVMSSLPCSTTFFDHALHRREELYLQ